MRQHGRVIAVMSTVPALDPAFFEAVVDRVHSVVDGVATIDSAALNTARDQVQRMSGGQGSEAQAVLLAVAFERCPTERVFNAFIARFGAFMSALANGERQAIWATRQWVRVSDQAADRVAPARFLHAIAATCPLRVGAHEFDMAEFERRALHASKSLR